MPAKHESRRSVSAEYTSYPVGGEGGGGTLMSAKWDAVTVLVVPVMVVEGVVGCRAGVVIFVVAW